MRAVCWRMWISRTMWKTVSGATGTQLSQLLIGQGRSSFTPEPGRNEKGRHRGGLLCETKTDNLGSAGAAEERHRETAENHQSHG